MGMLLSLHIQHVVIAFRSCHRFLLFDEMSLVFTRSRIKRYLLKTSLSVYTHRRVKLVDSHMEENGEVKMSKLS